MHEINIMAMLLSTVDDPLTITMGTCADVFHIHTSKLQYSS